MSTHLTLRSLGEARCPERHYHAEQSYQPTRKECQGGRSEPEPKWPGTGLHGLAGIRPMELKRGLEQELQECCGHQGNLPGPPASVLLKYTKRKRNGTLSIPVREALCRGNVFKQGPET